MNFAALDPKLRQDDDGGRYVMRAVVETPRGSRHKYAWDPSLEAFTFKQTLPSGLSWPYDYGFIPQTIGGDNDPLDLLVLMDDGTFTGCVLEVHLLGGIDLTKDGESNPRFIAALLPQKETSLSTDGYEKLSDLPDALVRELETFLTMYAEEGGSNIKVNGRVGRKDALAWICESHRRWKSLNR